MRISVGDALFTKAQQMVLSLLLGQPEKSFYLNEVVRYAAMGRGVISRELAKLTDAGLLIVRKQGNQNHYQANTASPIYHELLQIVQKTFGISGVLKASLATILPHCEHAFIYGSIAKGDEHAGSDIDVMLVGADLNYSEIMTLLEPAEVQLQRPINPTLYSVAEFEQRLSNENAFLTKVMAQSRLDLLADSE